MADGCNIFPARGVPTTLGHLLGCFAEYSVARSLGVLGAWRESLVGGGNCSAVCWVITGLSLKCQSLGLCCEISPQHPLGIPRSSCVPLQLGTMPPFSLSLAQVRGEQSPQGWGFAVLGFAGGSSTLSLQMVSLAGVPLPVPCPKSCSGVVLSWWWLLPKKVFPLGA